MDENEEDEEQEEHPVGNEEAGEQKGAEEEDTEGQRCGVCKEKTRSPLKVCTNCGAGLKTSQGFFLGQVRDLFFRGPQNHH
jgi:hypothetical protein